MMGSQRKSRESESSFIKLQASEENHIEPEEKEQTRRECSFLPKKAGVMTYITPLHLHNFASGSNELGSEKEAQGKAAAASRCSVQ